MLWFLSFIMLAVCVGIAGVLATNDRRIVDVGPDPLRFPERRAGSRTAADRAMSPDGF